MMDKLKICCLMFFLVLVCTGIQAQTTITVTGTITDTSNNPIIGATVSIQSTKNIAITDIDGKYVLKGPSNGTLIVNYIGMQSIKVPIDGRSTVNVILKEDVNQLHDVIVVGYGTQKRGSLTGAVSAVSGDEMLHTKNENPQNMLTGRIPGVRVWQKSAEPGSYNNNFDIRGMGSPLVIIFSTYESRRYSGYICSERCISVYLWITSCKWSGFGDNKKRNCWKDKSLL